MKFASFIFLFSSIPHNAVPGSRFPDMFRVVLDIVIAAAAVVVVEHHWPIRLLVAMAY